MHPLKRLLGLAAVLTTAVKVGGTPIRAVVFGGGPVGLYAAIKLRELGYEVSVFEKRPAYTRIQLFAIREDSPDYNNVSSLPIPVKNKLLLDSAEHGTPINNPLGSTETRFYPKRTGTFDSHTMISVPFNSLEKVLLNYATSKGVQYRLCNANSTIDGNGDIQCTDKSSNDYSVKASDYEILVCSDGSNSQCRAKMFPGIKRIPLGKYAPEEFDGFGFNAVIEGHHLPASIKAHLASVSDKFEAPRIPQHRYRSFITRQGMIYVGIALTKAEYERFKHLNRGSLVKGDPAADELWQEIVAQMAYYRILLDQADFDGIAKTREHFKLSFYPIKVEETPKDHYATTKTVPGKASPNLVALLGDSNFAVHYFTNSGLNGGMRMVNTFVDGLKKSIANNRKAISGWTTVIANLNNEHGYVQRAVMVAQNAVTSGLDPYSPPTLTRPRAEIQNVLVNDRKLPASFVQLANDTTLAVIYKAQASLALPTPSQIYEGDLYMLHKPQPSVAVFLQRTTMPPPPPSGRQSTSPSPSKRRFTTRSSSSRRLSSFISYANRPSDSSFSSSYYSSSSKSSSSPSAESHTSPPGKPSSTDGSLETVPGDHGDAKPTLPTPFPPTSEFTKKSANNATRIVAAGSFAFAFLVVSAFLVAVV